MNKIALIAQREFLTRVRKRTFVVMTILGPILFAATIFLPALLLNSSKECRRVVVVDETHSFCGILNNTPAVNFDNSYCIYNINDVRKIFADSSKVSILQITTGVMKGQVTLYSNTHPNSDVMADIAYELNSIVERSNMKANNLDPATIDAVKSDIKVEDVVQNKSTSIEYNQALGYASSLIIYMFILLYSVQVMRGVMEEKINRIVEIIISSVKPFQLMMGKVIGVSLVGLTQFLIWVVMSFAIFTFGSSQFYSKQINPTNAKVSTEQTMKRGTPEITNAAPSAKNVLTKADALNALQNVADTNWPLEIGCFVFYFLAGYLLYSSLFAAVGSAVDQETETQQFMLPLTLPLVASLVVAAGAPQSTAAMWLSIIPFTSPIAMMARIPFGVSIWQLLLSASLLIIFIFGTVWLAGRIYRVGLLMYGKKVTYRELGKWLFYK